VPKKRLQKGGKIVGGDMDNDVEGGAKKISRDMMDIDDGAFRDQSIGLPYLYSSIHIDVSQHLQTK